VKVFGKAQWEWIATARVLARQRPSTVEVEQVLDGLRRRDAVIRAEIGFDDAASGCKRTK